MVEAIFRDLCRSFGAAESLETELWLEIGTHYAGPGRFYHTLSHLEFMGQQLQPVLPQLEDAEMVLFALFYHDIYYDVPGKNNEERSAELAVQRLTQLNVSPERIERCRRHILATKRHERSDDPDTDFFTDADLSTLGADPETYRRYADNVRREYAAFPGFIYRPGRKSVLMHFLKMPRIYKTDYFFEKLEAAARRNLQEEIGLLSG